MANYRISELDFDQIKNNLKQFLSNYRDTDNNLVFKDYDFDASSLSILLDVLSYNTHYNAYLANMVANEMFLDSAVKRESAVSIAKHLGYTPLSYRSARAAVTFEVPEPIGSPGVLTLPRFSQFITTIEGTAYTFCNLESFTIRPTNGQYIFSNIAIVQGEPLSYTYRVDVSGPSEKYTIPNKNIDTTTIRVTVQNSYTELTQKEYSLAESLSGLTSDSNVYFLEQNPSGYYEIYFGDNILGKKLSSGNLVIIEYLVSAGSEANVSKNILQEFTLGITIGGVNLPSSITATENSTGGTEGDTLEEIKFKAPRFVSSFNRAVTANDYKSVIEASYPLVESVSVWGGEENVPPVYGKVFISLKPYSGYTINQDLKNKIKTEVLADKRMVTTIPEFVDPNYLYISLDTRLKLDSKNAKYTPSQIEILVKNEIETYFASELQKFNKDFVYSRLSKKIDSIDNGIVGNVTSFKIHKRISPGVNTATVYTGTSVIKFANKLVSGSISTSGFYYKTDTEIIPVYIKDSITSSTIGDLNLYNLYTDALIVSKIGTVNYTSGQISMPSLTIAGYFENSPDIKIYSKIEELDIQSSRDLILIIDDSLTNTVIKQIAGLSVTVSIV